MRKVIMLIGLSIVFFNASAQLQINHAFNDQASINMHMIRLENSGQKICVVNRMDSISYQFVFYNLDYSAFQTISVNLAPLFIVTDHNDPSLSVSYIAENVFDQDNDIDILCHLTYYDDTGAEYAQVVIFHQNGSTLFKSDIDNTNTWLLTSSATNSSIISSLTNTDQGAKMILDVYYFNDGLYSYDVYDLPGTLPSSMAESGLIDESAGNYLRAYPVPANEFVDMDYKLANDQNTGTVEIVDEQGKTIQKIRVDGSRGIIRIPVTQYKNGLYLYKLNTKRGIPRSGKMMIVR